MLKLGEQKRQTGVAMFLYQASAPLPGYPLSQTCLASLELQVSSGLFRRGRILILVHQGSVKKREVVHEGFTLSRGTQSSP